MNRLMWSLAFCVGIAAGTLLIAVGHLLAGSVLRDYSGRRSSPAISTPAGRSAVPTASPAHRPRST